MTTRGNLTHNERIKLTATYLNGLAVAVFAVGGVAPVLTILNADTPPKPGAVAFTVICYPISAALHYLARRWLKELRE